MFPTSRAQHSGIRESKKAPLPPDWFNELDEAFLTGSLLRGEAHREMEGTCDS